MSEKTLSRSARAALLVTMLGGTLGTVAQSAAPAESRDMRLTEPVIISISDNAMIANLLRVTQPELVIHPGDLLSVRILEIEKYEYKVRVSTGGLVNLPLIDTLSLSGKTPDEATTLVTKRLEEQDMVRRPHVYVAIDEQPSQVVTVAGEVLRPDVFAAPTARTLWGAISKAGGLKDTASTVVTLIRPADGESYPIQLGATPATSPVGSIPVFAGDTIVIKKLGVVYVVGAVRISGAFPLKNYAPTTVAQAVALAGNAGFEADMKNARIVRRLQNTMVEIPVDLRNLRRSSEQNPILQDGDILLIPTNNMRAVLKSGGANVAASLATAALLR
jgi:polysaccharide export outer membrane protein